MEVNAGELCGFGTGSFDEAIVRASDSLEPNLFASFFFRVERLAFSSLCLCHSVWHPPVSKEKTVSSLTAPGWLFA